MNPARARITDTSVPAPPQLQVLYKGKDLDANVSAVIVYFWNDGKLPIKAEDVLEPITINFDPACEIIDARVLKVSRSVTKFGRGEITRKNSLPISFSILEQNDGATVQIIYSGKPDTSVSMSGTITRAGSPRRALSNDEPPEAREGTMRRTLLTVAILIVSLNGMVVGTFMALKSPRPQHVADIFRVSRRHALLALASSVIAGGGAYFIMRPALTPRSPIPPSTLKQ